MFNCTLYADSTYSGVLICGHLSESITLDPDPNLHPIIIGAEILQHSLPPSLTIIGFVPTALASSPPTLSQHFIVPTTVSSVRTMLLPLSTNRFGISPMLRSSFDLRIRRRRLLPSPSALPVLRLRPRLRSRTDPNPVHCIYYYGKFWKNRVGLGLERDWD